MSILSKPWRVFSPALGQSLSFLTASNVTASQSQSHGAACTDTCRTYERQTCTQPALTGECKSAQL